MDVDAVLKRPGRHVHGCSDESARLAGPKRMRVDLRMRGLDGLAGG